MQEKLHKYMASCGVASRRKSEALILEGVVEVNGEKITSLGHRIDPSKDIVKVKASYGIIKENTDCIAKSLNQGQEERREL